MIAITLAMSCVTWCSVGTADTSRQSVPSPSHTCTARKALSGRIHTCGHSDCFHPVSWSCFGGCCLLPCAWRARVRIAPTPHPRPHRIVPDCQVVSEPGVSLSFPLIDLCCQGPVLVLVVGGGRKHIPARTFISTYRSKQASKQARLKDDAEAEWQQQRQRQR